MIKRREIHIVIISMCAALSLLCTSCGSLQPRPDQTKVKQESKITPPAVQKRADLAQYAALEQKGDDDIKAGNYRSALNGYNHLLSKYSGKDRERLLGKTEALLSIMKNSDLEIVLKSTTRQIPESMLLYRLGVNYASKGEKEKSKEMLSKLMADYHDNPHAAEVEKILKELEKSSFAKNSIGCMLPLSGKYETFGKQALRGIQMAQQDLKELYKDQDIVFVIKDTESNDIRAVSCVNELANTNVAGIVGPMVTSEAAAKEAQKQKMPMVCITQKSEVTSAGDYIFANFITPEIQIKGLVGHASNLLGIKKFAILYPDDKYGQTFMALFRQAVAEAGANMVVTEVYSATQTDFSSVMKKLALAAAQGSNTPSQSGNSPSASADGSEAPAESSESIAIFIPDSPSRAALILPQLIYYNVQNFYLLGTNIWHNNALLKLAPEHVSNVVITDGYFAQSTRPDSASFAERFKATYGEEPGLIEAIAYDTASMLIKTAMDPAIDSRESIKSALAGNIIYSGVTGETMFEANGTARKELFFLTIKNSSFVEIHH